MANGAGFSGKSAPWMLGALAAAVIGGGIWYAGRAPQPGAVLLPAAEGSQPETKQSGTDPAGQTTAQAAEPAPSAPSAPSAASETPENAPPEAAPPVQTDTAGSETDAPDTTGVDSAATATTAPEASAPETPTTNAEPAFRAPDFDVVRVETDGSALIAGSAAPGAQVRFLLDNKEIGVTRADTGGKFAAFLTLEPSKTPRVLTLLATGNGQQSESEDQIILAPVTPVAPVEVAEAETAPEPEPAPQIAAVADEPEAAPQPSGDAIAAASASETSQTESEPAPMSPVAVAQAEPEAEPDAPVQTTEPEQGTEPAQQLAQIAPQSDPAAAADSSIPVPAAPQAEAVPSAEPASPQTPQPQTQQPQTPQPQIAEAAPETATTVEVTEQAPDPAASVDAAPATQALTETQDPEIAAVGEANLAGDQEAPKPQPEAQTPVAEAAPAPEPEVEPAPAAAPDPAPQVAQIPPAAEPSEAPASESAPVEATPVESTGTEVAGTEEDPGEEIALAQTAPGPVPAPRAPEISVPEARTSDPALAPAPTQDTQTPPVPTGAQADPPAAPGAVAVLRATRDGIELLQPATPRRPEAMAQIALDTIGYSETGDVQLSGRAQGKSVVRIYLDNKPVADLNAAEDGQWKGQLSGITPGIYTLRLDELGQTGQVLSRLETPFKRESPEVLNPPAPENAPEHQPLIRAVTVQKGDTLWAISRSRYGDGLLYVRVFQANRTSIRDPDLIYPGQVFALPD